MKDNSIRKVLNIPTFSFLTKGVLFGNEDLKLKQGNNPFVISSTKSVTQKVVENQIPFIDLFKDVMTGKKKRIEINEKGEVIEENLKQAKNYENDIIPSINILDKNSAKSPPKSIGSDIAGFKKAISDDKYMKVYKLPIFEKNYQIYSEKNYIDFYSKRFKGNG